MKGKWIKTLVLLCIAFFIWLFTQYPLLVEQLYATGFYAWFSPALRAVTAWLPFSAGDVLYGLASVWLLWRLIVFIMVVLRRQWNKASFINGLRRNINRLLGLYIVFNMFWALNYHRPGIAYQLKISPAEYDTAALKALTNDLILQVNNCRLALGNGMPQHITNKQIFSGAAAAYAIVEKQHTFLHYAMPSVKASLFSNLGNYLGYLGYYNPFTGEAQVNVQSPRFLLPYVTCHEIAHQLGYASESEANFVGYLAAKSSTDKRFNYAVYFDLFNYANGELYYRDSLAARANYKRLDTLVKLDVIAYRKYLRAYRNPVEPIIKIFYSNYLKANNQPKGIDSYNEVVAWLIAYKNKYGKI